MNTKDYKKAKNILKRYSYNYIKITDLGIDIINETQEDEIKNCINEYKIVRQALTLIPKDCEDILEKYYVKRMSKWEILNDGMSERTFERRMQSLIYAVAKEYKKSKKNTKKNIII